MVGCDFECQIEGLACSDDTKVLIENNERFSDRIHDSVSKFPGVLDVVNCFLNMWRPSRGRGVYRTLSPDAPTYAEDNFNLRPSFAVGDTNRRVG